MPHINRVRLVNVNFNDAKGIYDDFVMELNGKSTTYDLMNTGGKSLLLLMMLQTVIPNSYLKKEKPIKNIFIGGNTKRTSHCLIEWILDDGYEYQYMLTGFCARKRQEVDESEQESENKLEIDYYNYCYFYNKNNKYNIKTLPLVENENNEKVYMSYDKLRQFLNNLKREGEQVEIFDSKKDYVKHIEYYGLIGAEWKLISEINVSENYIEKYFKENKTSRKLIENFLIRIIDNVNEQTRDGQEDANQLAETLIKLKENLMEFRKKSDNKNEYCQAKELYHNLEEKNSNLSNKFSEVNVLHQKAYEAYCVQKNEINILNAKIKDEKTKIEELITQKNDAEKQNSKLRIDQLYYELRQIEQEKGELEKDKDKAKQELGQASKQLELAKAQNEYIEYQCEKGQVNKLQIQIDNLSIGEDDIQKDYMRYGYNYKMQLDETIKKLTNQLEEEKKNSKQREEAKSIAKKQENQVRDDLARCKNNIENIERQIKEKQSSIEEINQELTEKGKVNLLLDAKSGLEEEKEEVENLQKQKDENGNKIEELNSDITRREGAIIQFKANKTLVENELKNAKIQVEEYETKKRSIQSLAKTFQNSETPEKLRDKLEEELADRERSKNSKQISKQIKQRKLDLMEQYHMVVPNEEIIRLKEELASKCTYLVTGIEKLMEMSEDKREEVLKKNPLFIYSIFVDEASFLKIRNKQFEMEVENLVPIASVEILRNGQECDVPRMIFPVQKQVYESLSPQKLEEYKLELSKNIEKLEQEIQTIKQKESEIKGYLEQTNYFIETYTDQKVESLFQNKEASENKLNSIESEIKNHNREIQNHKEEVQDLQAKAVKIEEKIEELKQEVELLTTLITLHQEINQVRDRKNKETQEKKALEELLQERIDAVDNAEYEANQLKDKIRDIENKKQNCSSCYLNLPDFKQTEVIQESFEEIKTRFEALNERVGNSQSELSNLQTIQQLHKSAMEKCKKAIEENQYTIEYFETSNEHFEKLLDSQIEERIHKKQEASNKYEEIESKRAKRQSDYDEINGKIGILIEDLAKTGQEYQESERVLDLGTIEKMMADNTTLIKVNKKEVKQISDKIEEVDKKIKNIEKEYNNLENFVEDKQIQRYSVEVEKLLKSEVYSYQRIRVESSKLNDSIQTLQTDFTNYMNHIKECVESFYIKQDVLDILQEIKIPVKLEECEQIKKGITIIIEQLEEKIRHIEEALRSLEGYQKNFITKCFEKAETIVKDLEKLPGLSRIKIGGKDVNIIKLELYEYEQEEKKKRMEDYIYKIVEDMEQRPEEMTKEQLNERLSSKALVAQVINMDKASIKLYKIEDIQEHSTYKKWEDDLGSDGQVNAIYFMFAVCIISYISMLTRREASSKTKKVIIVDNPFGATSAVFLWNVMFSVLKENNVQLIAPGHNINKEIISKFEVNYVLKHEYYNGNKKSVVVDKELRTEDDLESLNFETIEGTQQSMF